MIWRKDSIELEHTVVKYSNIDWQLQVDSFAVY